MYIAGPVITNIKMAVFDVHLLAAGFSAILGVEVVHPDRGSHLPKLSIHDLFQLTYIPWPLQNVNPGELFDIHIKTLTGNRITIQVTNAFTIAHVKAAIEQKEKIPARDQRLVFSSKRLDDSDTIESAKIPHGGTLFLIIKLRGGGPEYQLDLDELAPSYDYNFTKESDDGRKYMRGKFVYHRPYGWYRFALNVLGKYGNNEWLGPNGIRTETSTNEWPVSYHGTNMEGAEGITDEGYSIEKSKNFAYGKGIYSSPDLSVAYGYSQQFYHNGHYHSIILQNRVNPDEAGGHLEIKNKGKYWICPKQDPKNGVYDIRPYGVLISLPENKR